jgi:hypothetical protein
MHHLQLQGTAMAEHGEVEYSTADGNDYQAHEGTYASFVHFVFVGLILCVNILFALAVGGVMGHWLTAAGLLILVHICAAIDLGTGGRTMTYVGLVVSFVAFALLGLS